MFVKVAKWTGLGVVVVVLCAGGYLWQKVRGLEVARITDDLHVIFGLGGNVAVLRTGEGTVLVDTMLFSMQGERIKAQAEALTGEPVAVIINTHYHSDHTHGNPAFADTSRVVSTARTRAYLDTLDGEYWQDAQGTLPSETFEHEHVVTLGDKTIRLVHPGRGHTDGDLVAIFEEDAAVHMGDLYFNRSYPNIDLEAGGSVVEWPQTLDRVVALAGNTDPTVIPGHGRLSDLRELADFRRFIAELASVGADAAARGRTLEQTLAETDLREDEGYVSPIDIPLVGGLDRNFVVRRAWEEATGNFERVVLSSSPQGLR